MLEIYSKRSELFPFAEVSEDIKTLLSQRMSNKLWKIDTLDIQKTQQEIIEALNNLNNNIAAIKKYFEIDVSFLKKDLGSFIHSENSSEGLVQDSGGIIILCLI